MARAEAADAEPLLEGLNLPEKLARCEARLQAIGEVKAEIGARAQSVLPVKRPTTKPR